MSVGQGVQGVVEVPGAAPLLDDLRERLGSGALPPALAQDTRTYRHPPGRRGERVFGADIGVVSGWNRGTKGGVVRSHLWYHVHQRYSLEMGA